MTDDSDSNAELFVSGNSVGDATPLTFRAPPTISNCAKSIIDRKLRKYASETSFATETASESSCERGDVASNRRFTVKPVATSSSSTAPTNRMVYTNGARTRRRHDSDASGSANSEATVASLGGPNNNNNYTNHHHHTPRRCHFRRPKSTTEMHQSCTSATIHSLDSQHPNDERRESNMYMMDDDSVHEFEDDDGMRVMTRGKYV